MHGNSDSKATNKTEFMRYLNESPDAVKSLSAMLSKYKSTISTGNKFGDWLRQKHLSEFIRAYRSWWLNHPELFGKIYQQQESLSV